MSWGNDVQQGPWENRQCALSCQVSLSAGILLIPQDLRGKAPLLDQIENNLDFNDVIFMCPCIDLSKSSLHAAKCLLGIIYILSTWPVTWEA